MDTHKKHCLEKCIIIVVCSAVILLTVLASWIFRISIEHSGSVFIFFMAFIIICDCLKNYATETIKDEEKRLRLMRLIYTIFMITVVIGLFIFIWLRR